MVDNIELLEIEALKKIKQDAINKERVQLILQEFTLGKTCSDKDATLVMEHHRKHPEDYDKLRTFLAQNYNRVVTNKVPERKFSMGMS